MFVSSNKLSAIKKYFKERLQNHFSESEIKYMFNSAAEERLAYKNAYLLLEDISLSESDLLFFRAVVKRLLAEEPFQQIIGFTEFYGLKIAVTKDVLTPRPETEELVHIIIQETKKESPIIADFCSGSGCISLALKKQFPKATVYGFEKSSKAIVVAKQNASQLQIEVDFQEVDVLQADFVHYPKVDILVSNPPYIRLSEKKDMSNTVLKHEPDMALFVEDTDPLIFYRQIAQIGKEILLPKGKVYFEINEYLGEETSELLRKIGYQEVNIHRDLQGKQRIVEGYLPN